MFLIFGLRTTLHRHGASTGVCPVCGNQATQVVTRRSTKLTLFFVPLIPVRTRYTRQCTYCGAEYAVSRAEADRHTVG